MLRRSLTLAATGLACPAIARAQLHEPAEEQRAFQRVLRSFAERAAQPMNPIARQALRRERDAALNPSMLQARGWLGVPFHMAAESDGRATFVVQLRGIPLVLLTNRDPADLRRAVLIPPTSPMHPVLASLRPGDSVRFDASLLCYGRQNALTECPVSLGESDDDALRNPAFLVRFTSIARLGR